MLLAPKMKQEQITNLRHSRWPALTLQLTFLGLLSACGAGTTAEPALGAVAGAAVGAASEAPVAGPSVSAAQLSNDTSYSIGFAQAVAAGVEAAPEKATSAVTSITSTESAEAIPTANAAEPDASGTSGTSGPDNIVIPTAGNITATDNEPNDNSTDLPILPAPDPEPPITDLEPLVTDPEPEPPATDSELLITDSEQPATDSEPSVTDPEPPTTEEQSPTTNLNSPATQIVEAPTDSTVNDNEPVEPTDSDPTTTFSSSTTPGFNGQVLTNSIRITWPVDPDARGYNVYRQAQYVTSVFTEEYIDEDVFDSNYYYEIQAFDNSDALYYVATGLTVKARTFGTTDPDAPVPNTQLLEDYDLVFSDEFNGSVLDGTKWNTSYLWGTDLIINSEEQYYVDILDDPEFGFNPFTFDGDNLTISSIQTPSELAGKALNQSYLSGVITSYDAFKFTYGYIETRAKVTFGRGYWPAFWLLNAYYVDDMPEIDIMEFIGHNQDVVYHTYHYYDSEGQLRSTPSQPTPGVDYTADFHTYSVEWKPNTIIFYIDNIEVHRVVDPKVSQQDMYVIANTALGGWWAGSPDNTTPFPGEFVIDYIRVYQKSEPYDDVLLNDGVTQVPYADQIFGTSSPSHRPSREDWPEGYPSGQ